MLALDGRVLPASIRQLDMLKHNSLRQVYEREWFRSSRPSVNIPDRFQPTNGFFLLLAFPKLSAGVLFVTC